MDFINNHKLIKNGNTYTIVLYLDKIDSEFADEFGNIDKNKKSQFSESIQEYIKEKFPNIKITACKVMLGTMLVTAVPLINIGGVNASTTSYLNHTVQVGDTLWKLAGQYDTSIDAIKSNNNLSNNTIYINQALKIPKAITIYEVKKGDTLYRIAKDYNTTVDNIKQLNKLSSNTIYIGQILNLSVEQGITNTTPSSYTVNVGDTLWAISRNNGISVTTIKSINNLTTDTIYPGQVLRLKESVSTVPTISYITYTIKSGDNIFSIALNNGIPQAELLKVNNFNENTILSIGQKITIPVHRIPIQETKGEYYGEYLDWWTEAQYVFAINDVAKVTDLETGKIFMVKRTIGANHADAEPLKAVDTAIAKGIWGGYSWRTRAVIVEVDGRKIAASMSFMPHSIQYITDNSFDGHFDIHFKNSTRHKDGMIDNNHQEMIKVAAGVISI